MKLYYQVAPLSAAGSAAYEAATWLEMTPIRDVTMGDEWGTTDASDRSTRRKQSELTLRDGPITVDFKWKPTNAAFIALRAAFAAGNKIAIACLDGPEATSGSQGVAGNFYVSKFPRAEPLEGLVTSSVELVPADETVDDWIVGQS